MTFHLHAKSSTTGSQANLNKKAPAGAGADEGIKSELRANTELSVELLLDLLELGGTEVSPADTLLTCVAIQSGLEDLAEALIEVLERLFAILDLVELASVDLLEGLGIAGEVGYEQEVHQGLEVGLALLRREVQESVAVALLLEHMRSAGQETIGSASKVPSGGLGGGARGTMDRIKHGE